MTEYEQANKFIQINTINGIGMLIRVASVDYVYKEGTTTKVQLLTGQLIETHRSLEFILRDLNGQQ